MSSMPVGPRVSKFPAEGGTAQTPRGRPIPSSHKPISYLGFRPSGSGWKDPEQPVSSQGGGAVPSSHHLQESVRPLEAPAAWAPVMLEGAQVSGTLGAVGTREGSRGEKVEG